MVLLVLFLLSCEARREYPEVSKINWERDWERAVQRAGEEGKPIFIYFYAVWCSWCREYEEVLERPRVRTRINGEFIPLLLDIDRDRRAFLRFGGRGTPFTVILSPRGDLLVRFHGVAGERDLLEVMGVVLQGELRAVREKGLVPLGEISLERCRGLKASFLEDLRVRFDPAFGGFSSPSEEGAIFKWPTPLTYTYLIERGYLLDEALFSLDKDIEYLFDRVDGGFFNFYDRSRAFEFYFETSKSLRVNGQMIGALVEAFRRTGEERYLRTAIRTFEYMERHLLDKGSGCYLNAQVSDPEYYNLPPEKRKKPPPPDTAIIVEDNSRTILSLLRFGDVSGDPRVRRRVERCVGYILSNLLEEGRIYRFYDVRSGKRGTPNFGMDVALFSLALLESGREREALKVASLRADHSWVSYSVLAYTLAKLGERERALEILRDLKIDPSYHNPDDMVFLIRALELLIERC